MTDDSAGQRRLVLTAGLWSAGSVVVPMVGTALLSVTMGRILGSSLLGQQSLIAYVEATVAALLIQALTDTAIRSLAAAAGAGDSARFGRLSHWSTLTILISGLLTGVIVAGIGLLGDDPLPWLVAGLTSVVNGIGWGFGARLIASQGWSPVAKRRLLWQSVAQALGIVAVLGGLGIVGVFWANLVAAAGLAIMLRRITPRTPRSPWQPFPRDLVRLWLMFVLVQLLTQVVSKRVEFLFLGTMSTTQQLAMYSIPFMVVSSVALLPASVFQAGMPSVAASAGAGRLAESASDLAPALRVTAVVSLPLAALVGVTGPPLVMALYGPEFQEAAALVPLMSLGFILTPLADVCLYFWLGAGRVRNVVIATSIGGAIDIALAFVLVPRQGALGAAIANLAGQAIMAGILGWLTWLAAGRFRWPVRRWLGALAASGIAALAGWFAGRPFDDWFLFGVTAMACLAVLALYGWTVGFVERRDTEWLRSSTPTTLQPLVRVLTGP